MPALIYYLFSMHVLYLHFPTGHLGKPPSLSLRHTALDGVRERTNLAVRLLIEGDRGGLNRFGLKALVAILDYIRGCHKHVKVVSRLRLPTS